MNEMKLFYGLNNALKKWLLVSGFRVLLFLTLLGYAEEVKAQLGNEWINYSQQYFKIPVAETGFYQITQAELASAGISGIDPQSLKLYHRGKEQAIYLEGEEDNTLDNGDYLVFYGQQNDGSLDRGLYLSQLSLVNKYINPHSARFFHDCHPIPTLSKLFGTGESGNTRPDYDDIKHDFFS